MKHESVIFRLALLAGLFLVATPVLAAPKTSGKKLRLATDGKSPYQIVLATDATVVEANAAGEFQSCFEQITGATLPITRENEVGAQDGPFVFVGS